MSTHTVHLPDSVTKNIEGLSVREGFSVAQFLASGASEKLAVKLTMDYHKRESAAGLRDDCERYLAGVPAPPPMASDEM